MGNEKRILIALALALTTSLTSVVAGCSGNDLIKEDPAKAAKREDATKKMREYFDKSNGNYDSLSASDKTALNAITGSEKNSREAFGHMVPSSVGGGLPSHTGPSGAGR